MIKIFILILSIFLAIMLESFLGVLGGVSVVCILIMCFLGKITWKNLLLISLIVSFVLDVVNHYVLGTYLIIFGVVLGLFLLISLFIPNTNSTVDLIPYFLSFFVFYFLLGFLPHLISFGSLDGFSWVLFGGSLLKGFVSVLVLVVLNSLIEKFRGNKLSSSISLK